jgi:hypothetical protein
MSCYGLTNVFATIYYKQPPYKSINLVSIHGIIALIICTIFFLALFLIMAKLTRKKLAGQINSRDILSILDKKAFEPISNFKYSLPDHSGSGDRSKRTEQLDEMSNKFLPRSVADDSSIDAEIRVSETTQAPLN